MIAAVCVCMFLSVVYFFAHRHVAVGFTEDGRYFLTYTCNIRFQLTESSACGYKYTLFWWKFDLWRPLKKVCHLLAANAKLSDFDFT